jgi:hypothetical protein
MIAHHNPVITSKTLVKSDPVSTSTTSIELHAGRQFPVQEPTAGSILDPIKGIS